MTTRPLDNVLNSILSGLKLDAISLQDIAGKINVCNVYNFEMLCRSVGGNIYEIPVIITAQQQLQLVV